MSRILASVATASLLALAACNAPKTEEAAPDTVMTDPITTEVPATTDVPAVDGTAPIDETMAMPADPMAADPMAPDGDTGAMDDGPGNAGNDKGRPAGRAN